MNDDEKNIGPENAFSQLDNEEKILRLTAGYKMPSMLPKEEALKQIKARIAAGERVAVLPVSRKRLTFVVSMAASVILLMAIGFLLLNKPEMDVLALRGSHMNYQLPDGSDVEMNADSRISFRKNHFDQNRQLTLDGEAFFNIKKGNTFTIRTKLANIRILGTSFNVYARDSSFKVSCLTGKILVNFGKNSLIILPGESAVIRDNNLLKYTDKNISAITNWRNGEFYFENASLLAVFNELERQYNVRFHLPSIDNEYFTGSFSNKNLVDALDIVCIPMSLTYEIGSNGEIFIRTGPH